jgi:hypothetical protein
MAELGDFVEQGPKSRGEVTLEMMDYKFVDECTVTSLSPFALPNRKLPVFACLCNQSVEWKFANFTLKSLLGMARGYIYKAIQS